MRFTGQIQIQTQFKFIYIYKNCIKTIKKRQYEGG